jgi:putative ABC transport system permease protein
MEGMKRGATLTVFVVLSLTAGLTAVAVDVMAAYLWRPLPYPHSGRLVVADYPRTNGPSPRDLMRVDAGGVTAFADLSAASDPDSFTVIGGDVPFTTDGRWTGGDVFAMFGVTPVIGRVFTSAEAARGERVALVSDRIWREHFGGRADVVGRTVTIRAVIRRDVAESFTIIGVLPSRFWHLDDRNGVMLPLAGARPPALLRLREGVPIDDVKAGLTSMVRAQIPGLAPDWGVAIRSAQDAHVAPVRPMLTATAWGVAMLAIIALANLAFLQIARGVGRQREVAVRITLGASRGDLIWQAVRDGAGVGMWASAGASATAFLSLSIGAGGIERYVGRLVPSAATPLGSDPRLHLATAIVTIVASIVLSLIMLAASRSATVATALAGNASFTETPRRQVIRQLIVTAQIAVTFCLLVGAALMVRTSWHLGRLDLGFEPRGVLSANITLPDSAYRSLDDRREFFRALIARLERLPEVEHAGLTGWLPFRIGPAVTVVPEDAPLSSTSAAMQGVDAGYFTALRIRLREGRFLNEGDRAGRENAAVIGDTLAQALWSGQPALGRKFRIKFSPEPGRGFGPYTVVGVSEDVKQSVMNPTPAQLYLSFYQQPLAGNAFLQIRTRSDPATAGQAVARAVRDLDPELALGSVRALDSIVEEEGLRPRQLARALAAFAAAAVLIAVVGLSAVSTWIAQLRRREAALRIALGADRTSVTSLLARRGLVAIGAGLVLGWIAAWPLAASIASELRGVAASDASTRVLVAVVLSAVSIAALVGPAWRASTTDLAALLREQ